MKRADIVAALAFILGLLGLAIAMNLIVANLLRAGLLL